MRPKRDLGTSVYCLTGKIRRRRTEARRLTHFGVSSFTACVSFLQVSYQQGLLRDCLRLFCFFVLTYASAAARAKLLTHPRGTTGSSNGRRSSSLSPLQRSSSPGRRDKSRDEEVLEKDVVFRESVDEFLQEYFSCKEADGLLAVPSPMNANKAQEWVRESLPFLCTVASALSCLLWSPRLV